MTDSSSVISVGPVNGRGRGTRAAVRAGLSHGWIELSHCFTMIEDAFEILPLPLLSVVALLVVDYKHVHLPGTHFLVGSTVLAGVLALNVSANGAVAFATRLTSDREDGTLLRAKATPNGMLGYLVGRIVVASGTVMLTVVGLLVVGLTPIGGLVLGRTLTWLTLAWVLPLGLLATLSIGAVVGSLFSSVRSASVAVMIGFAGLIGISGIFSPITQLPTWLQWVGQAFPLYWLGLGVRSAVLPGNLAAVEIGHSWRHLASAGVLIAWAIAGLVLAPILLRRVARREAGSSVAARRERVLARGR
ncbi:MAG TPA: ABC transporter permease [Streptosporangiaceae bacterium]|nr:ABC transporter permease [Streptosporangiaceae bacterium]